MDVSQGRVARGLPATPGGGDADGGGLVPDDLAAHEEAEVDQLLGDVGLEGEVGLAVDAGDVDADAGAGAEDAAAFGPDIAQK